MYNKVTLIGRLGRGVELKQTNSGKSFCNFSIAVNSGRDSSEWFDIVVWDKQAESCAKFLEKGRQVLVEGRLTTRQYEGRDGTSKSKTEIIANQVVFLGANSTGESSRAASPSQLEASNSFPTQDQYEDIPF